MQTLKQRMIGTLVLFIAIAAQCREQAAEILPLPPNEVPKTGTFWLAQGPDGEDSPPYPCLPVGFDAPVYSLGRGQFFVDNSEGNDQVLLRGLTAHSSISTMSLEFPGEGEAGSGAGIEFVPDTRRNYEKFRKQHFAFLNTNDVAVVDPNLYNALTSFPSDTNTLATLQIAPYGADAVIIKANKFDYSGESTRDFALLICDKVETAVWKNIDFAGESDSQDGWLVQGLVPNWQVADPMYFIVSNISHDANAFFRAIPYSGPQVTLSGKQPDEVVSNTIVLYAEIADLSGVTNELFDVKIDSDTCRFSLEESNSISLNTKYNPDGPCGVYLNVVSKATVYDLTNILADNAKLFFKGSGTLPLNFLNDTYMLYSGDNASPDIGEIYSLFVIDKAQDIEAIIWDPSDGHTVAYYAGNVPHPAIIQIPWDFTEADGVTPYSNDTYAVTFTAFDPTTITITNKIERHGVRTAAGCIVTYEEEDPALSGAPYLNSEASKWLEALAFSYESLYYWDAFSLTQFDPSEIGANRDNVGTPLMPFKLTAGGESNWANQVYLSLTNIAYSDFGYYMGHGNGTEIAGGPPGSTFIKGYMPSVNVKAQVRAGEAGRNWRMRKVALWACYTDSFAASLAGGTIPSWAEAFGINPTGKQTTSMASKNVGLFFQGGLPQGGYSGTLGGTCPEVSTLFDDLWVTGPTPFPGACDPTYAFSWVLNQIEGMCPEITKAMPHWIGFGYLPYAGIYDGELVTNNISHISR